MSLHKTIRTPQFKKLTNWEVLRRENMKAYKIIIVGRTYSTNSRILEWKNITIEQRNREFYKR